MTAPAAIPNVTVLARNTQPGPTVFALDASNNAVIEWKGAGDPMGEDMQPVPPEMLRNVFFQRAVGRGIIELVDAPEELTRVMGLQRQDWQNRMAAQKAATDASIDQAPQNDLTMVGCVHPEPNGTKCDTQVAVRVAQRDQKPPLCAVHVASAPLFVIDPHTKTGVNWVKIQMDPAQRQQQ